MNDEIKVGEYVRTDDGYIAKVIKKDKDGWYRCDSVVEECYDDYFKFFKKGDIYIEKHSPNILKVLENGDLVNGKYIVADIHSYGFYYFEDGGVSQNQIDVGDIETVITKEQFEKIMYRVEE